MAIFLSDRNHRKTHEKQTTRGTGVQRLLSVLGIDESEAMACGDAVNDVEMLKLVAKGVAMGISDFTHYKPTRHGLGGCCWILGVRVLFDFRHIVRLGSWASVRY